MKDQEDGLKKHLTWFLNLVMQLEAMEQIDVEPYQRVGSRKAHRNGYKERSLKTRVGELKLKKPQFREIPFQTKVFDRYSRVERINKEPKRRTRVAGAFPSHQTFMRLGVSILIDINEEWMTAKRYLSMDAD